MRDNIYKKHFFRIFFFLPIVTITIWFTIEAIDPYGINDNLFNFKYTFLSNSLRAAKLLKVLKNEKNILVFGTSRSLLISPEMLNENVINLHSIYGNPLAVLDFLNRLDDKSLKNIIKIYYLIDLPCFADSNYIYSYNNIDYENKRSVLVYKIKQFNLSLIQIALEKVWRNITGRFDYYIHPKGYKIQITDHQADIPDVIGSDFMMPSEDMLLVLSKVDKFTKDHSIEIVYFTPTFPSIYVERLDYELYSKQLRLFLNHIDGIYNFTYIDGISGNIELFSDITHMSTKGLKLLFQTQFNEKNYVTSKNINEHLEKYKALIEHK